MKVLKFNLLICLFIVFSVAVKGKNDSKKTTHMVTIMANHPLQQIEGWGSSLCWWANEVGRWDNAKIDTLIDLFTAPDKLNMNIFRYNIGGGDDPSHVGGHMVQGKGKRAEMEGFKASENAPYNWAADRGQRNILLKIKAKRPDVIFEAFSNSPPFWMTYSGCSAGNNGKYEENLKPEYYGAFCDYLIDVCSFYKDNYGIEFKTLEPFNEPTSGYWTKMGGQEGCYFSAKSQIEIIKILYPKLRASGLNTVISASDETSIGSFIKTMNAYIQDGNTLNKIGQLNTHSYQGSVKERKIAHDMVEPTGITFWQSETGPMGLGEPARGLKNNLLLTQKLFHDMRYMKPSAWIDWQLMEEHNDTWGLVKCDFDDEEFVLVKNLYVRMQITRFFKQGFSMVETDNDAVLAAVSPNGKELVISMLNTDEKAHAFNVDVVGLNLELGSVQVYRTSVNEDCQKIIWNKIQDGKEIIYNAPQLSISTFVFSFE